MSKEPYNEPYKLYNEPKLMTEERHIERYLIYIKDGCYVLGLPRLAKTRTLWVYLSACLESPFRISSLKSLCRDACDSCHSTAISPFHPCLACYRCSLPRVPWQA